MNNKNKIIYAIAITVVFTFSLYKYYQYSTMKIKNVELSECIEIKENTPFSYFKKYGTLRNHPTHIEHVLSGKNRQFHDNYNYYQITKDLNNELFLVNKYDQEIQLKIANKKEQFQYKECFVHDLNFKTGSCFEYTNLRTNSKSYWKVEKNNKENYHISGIYGSYLTNNVIKDGQKNPIFEHYNPELKFPIKVGKFQINSSAKAITCPSEIQAKFKEKDCISFENQKLKVVKVLKDFGVYETKIIDKPKQDERSPASINEELDTMISTIETEKLKYGWKDFYFLDQDKAEKVDCF